MKKFSQSNFTEYYFTSNVEIMNEYVTYNTTYHILICRQCGYAIPQDWIMRHFRQLHKTIPLAMRQDIINYGLSLELWHPSEVYEQWKNMTTKSPVDDLAIFSGFKCQFDDCMSYRRTEVSMKKHYRETHNWVAKDGIILIKEKLQSFFGGRHVKYISNIIFPALYPLKPG